MKIKTQSGVKIEIEPLGSSRMVIFDKPVRMVELGKEESFELSSLLNGKINNEEISEFKVHSNLENIIGYDKVRILDSVESEAKSYMKKNHFSGHDFAHILRVHKLCRAIGEKENADMLVLLASALLHDLARDQERKNPTINHAEKSAEIAEEILKKLNFPSEKIPAVIHAIRVHRFSKGLNPTTLEAKILQDADRIDISGAVGIAMTFAFGGVHNSELYNLEDPFAENRNLDDGNYTLDHFYTKLLHLPKTMHTKIGREVAEERRRFMQLFIEQMKAEVEGIK